MQEVRQSSHGHFSSRFVFILAAVSAAVGLGNIWRFPYLAGENGGGAFVLIYLLCVVLVCEPIMVAEVMLGRRGRQSPINTLKRLAYEEGASDHWKYLGWLGVVAGFLILSFYSVIAGWSLAYIFQTASGAFEGASAEAAEAGFNALVDSPARLIFWHSIFMLMVIWVVANGVEQGLENAVKWLMPPLFVLLLVMVGYAMGAGAYWQAVDYLFRPDFSEVTPGTVLAAMGQAFFSVSLGMGTIMAYGAYLPHDAVIPRTTMTVVACDTLVAILAGVAIFPIVFAAGLDPAGGPGLIFMTLTVAFGQMPMGMPFGTLFFILLTVAAWTSAISLLEPAVAWLVEHRRMSRPWAAGIMGVLAWVVGLGSALSFNAWADYTLFGLTFQGLSEYVSTTLMLPLGGVLIAVFAGYRMSRRASVEELGMGDGLAYIVWRTLVRYVAPLGVIAVFLNVVGVFG